MRINREQFDKWIRALRSGRYKQTRGSLHDGEGYCCLGVACKVLIPKNKLKTMSYGGDELLFGHVPDDQPAAPNWLKRINNDFAEKNLNDKCLSELNDEYDLSFKEIANLLVKTYPKK